MDLLDMDYLFSPLFAQQLATGLIIISLPTFISCLLVRAPYGRYNSDKRSWDVAYGFDVNGRFAWMLQESPTVCWAIYFVFFLGSPLVPGNSVNTVLLSYFVIHYIHRSFVFPFLLKGVKPTPFALMGIAWLFCFLNGYLQVSSLTTFTSFDSDWFFDPRFLIGSFLFWFGLGINHHSDYVLRNLRKPNEKGYKIPFGGAFTYVSAANYFGEILEWFGFAIATWSLVGLAFAVFTFCNIGPRGYQHHQNYLERFGDSYPKNRKAVIPFICQTNSFDDLSGFS